MKVSEKFDNALNDLRLASEVIENLKEVLMECDVKDVRFTPAVLIMLKNHVDVVISTFDKIEDEVAALEESATPVQ